MYKHKLYVEIECDNDAFGDTDLERCAEIARILFHAATNARDGRLYQPLYDSNGNRCGVLNFMREG